MSAVVDVLDAIARAIGPEEDVPIRLGALALTPSQAMVARRALGALTRHGGALVAERPGAGKTFVALAVARTFGRALVLAPATLRQSWRDAARQADVTIEFASIESVSRGAKPEVAPLIIVDEAHHVSHPGTRRYRAVAAMARRARLLLLTATPVRNAHAERDALLALFLGADAAVLDDATTATCLIRTTGRRTDGPRRVEHDPIPVPAARGIATRLRSLQPPWALDEGNGADALVRMGLARAWTSSVAALDQALVRRIQRGAAILSTLEAGRMPTRATLRAWVVGDDAMQMALSFDATRADDDGGASAERIVRAHLAGVEDLRGVARRASSQDTAHRVAALWAIVERHRGRTVIAFSCFEATARAIFGALRHRPGIVLLTGSDTRSGAGSLSRSDIVAALSPAAPRQDRSLMPLRLLIATDLLSEGVNLQRASVIVHLDEPWTPSALEQRVGRAARPGSTHDVVDVYRLRVARAAAALTAVDARHRRKSASATAAVAPGEALSRIRDVVARWRVDAHRDVREHRAVAAVRGSRDAIVSVIVQGNTKSLVVGRVHRSGWMVTNAPQAILDVLLHMSTDGCLAPAPDAVRRAATAILNWARRRAAERAAGLQRAPSEPERRLLTRVDHMLTHLPAGLRAAESARIGRIRARVAAPRGVGSSYLISDLLDRARPDGAWLAEVEASFGASVVPNHQWSGAEVEVILFVRRSGGTETDGRERSPASGPARPLPSTGPPAASPGTAAPR